MLRPQPRAEAAAETAQALIDPFTVSGWGVDADPENDPTWPMRDRSKDDGPGMNWDRPALQAAEVEILQSVEHVRRPASVGESTPPHGVSGRIRRQAFAFSESQWGHWLLLMLADRIDSVEGVVDDLKRGRFPNLLVETGLVKRARSREAATVTAIVVAGAALGLLLLARKRR